MPRAIRKAFSSSIMDDPRHLRRYLKALAVGGSEDAAATAIAREERVGVAVVKSSIRAVAAYRNQNDKTQFDYALRDLVISAIPQAKETLNDLLSATELVEVTNHKTGKKEIREMHDKTTRLEAVRALSTLAIGLQPKTPMVEVNTTQTNQVANISGGAGSAETTEERIRRLRKQAAQHRLMPPEVKGVPVHIDEGVDAGGDEDDGDEDDGGDE